MNAPKKKLARILINEVHANINQPLSGRALDAEIAKITLIMHGDRKAYDEDEELQERFRDLLGERELERMEQASVATKNIGQSGLANGS